jgi:Xaa-Pro aminopeptidase
MRCGDRLFTLNIRPAAASTTHPTVVRPPKNPPVLLGNTSMPNHANANAAHPPFDPERLDALMGEQGIDVILASSPHNVQYLLGGYRFFFFQTIQAVGVSRYLPIVVYLRGRPDLALYVGQIMEKTEQSRGELWTPYCAAESWGSTDGVRIAVEHLKKAGASPGRIGIETGFLPADTKDALAGAFGSADIVDALRPLERLRASKTPKELALLRKVSDGVVESLIATFAKTRPGMNKHEVVDLVRREQFARDIDFAVCQIAFGASSDRVPSEQTLRPGDVVSLDAVGSFKGYLGDLCRMGVAGEPDAELKELLAEIDDVQQTARRAIRAGVRGADLISAGDLAVATSPHRSLMDFTVHGMGLILHEAPRLAFGRPIPYPADDAETPLEVGMVLSVETSIRHPTRGFIKLEDTLAVTAQGSEPFSDQGRGWNCIGR